MVYNKNSIGSKIALLPAIAICTFIAIFGLDIYFDRQIFKADLNGERGINIDRNLSSSLLLESMFIAEADKVHIPKIEKFHSKIKNLVKESKKTAHSIITSNLLISIDKTINDREEVFHETQKIVIQIDHINKLLNKLYQKSDQQLNEIINSIDAKATLRIIDGEYLPEVLTAFRNSLKEFSGFSSSAMLNTNNLLFFSDEKNYITEENKLSGELILSSKACENYAAVTGEKNHLIQWEIIKKNYEKIKIHRQSVYHLFQNRQMNLDKLSLMNISLQKSAHQITELSKKEMSTLKRQSTYYEVVLIFIITAIFISICTALIKSITIPLIRISESMERISKGKIINLKRTKKTNLSEIQKLEDSFYRLGANSDKIIEMALKLGQGDYDIKIIPRSEDDKLSQSLINMTKSLKQFHIELENRSEILESLVDKKTIALKNTIEDLKENIRFREKAELERTRMKARLLQAQKMESIGTLAGGIAHDFNNILFPIVGYTEMLLEDTPENSPTRDSLNQIYTSALRAKSLVKQILTFSRQESSELMLIKMQPIIKEALKLIRSTIPTTIEIKQDIHPDCGVIKAPLCQDRCRLN